MINIVLIEPEIPQNTGNIARTCVAADLRLHLVKPFGFTIDDKTLKRAGLDYWQYLDVIYYDNLQEFLDIHSKDALFFATTKAKNIYSEITYPSDCYILFGKETKGLPEDLLKKNYDKSIRIPMYNDIRSLNLSNSVSIIAYEVLRQRSFYGLKCEGELHNS